VGEVEEADWQPLKREIDGRQVETGQEWAEVCFVPAWTAKSKNGPNYRFIAIRELLRQQEFPGMEVQLPFPTYHRGEKQYKLHGLVTNRDLGIWPKSHFMATFTGYIQSKKGCQKNSCL
jgi:hypothetical protein